MKQQIKNKSKISLWFKEKQNKKTFILFLVLILLLVLLLFFAFVGFPPPIESSSVNDENEYIGYIGKGTPEELDPSFLTPLSDPDQNFSSLKIILRFSFQIVACILFVAFITYSAFFFIYYAQHKKVKISKVEFKKYIKEKVNEDLNNTKQINLEELENNELNTTETNISNDETTNNLDFTSKLNEELNDQQKNNIRKNKI